MSRARLNLAGAALALLLALAACGTPEDTGGLSRDDARALDEVARDLDVNAADPNSQEPAE